MKHRSCDRDWNSEARWLGVKTRGRPAEPGTLGSEVYAIESWKESLGLDLIALFVDCVCLRQLWLGEASTVRAGVDGSRVEARSMQRNSAKKGFTRGALSLFRFHSALR